jgi:hypothetical protein|tara:strand:- start:170 stop:376 length:207 start_codon:yes stop_codon:yes gene_type:complete
MIKKEAVDCYLQMKSVLEFYADRDNYKVKAEEDMSIMRFDEGEKARLVLKACETISKRILLPEPKLQQ